MTDFFARWWSVLKLPPAVPSGKTKSPELVRRQRRLIGIASGAILASATAWGIYGYVASAPQRADLELQAGMRLMDPATYRQAVPHFDHAIRIWPQLAEAYLNRGIAHGNLGEIDQALADFDRALDADPELARAHDELGIIYRDRGDAKRAMEEFSRSLEIAPSVDEYFQRGQMYEAMGEHRQAIDDYDKAVAQMRDAPYVYRARAIAREHLGDRSGAARDRDLASAGESLR